MRRWFSSEALTIAGPGFVILAGCMLAGGIVGCGGDDAHPRPTGPTARAPDEVLPRLDAGPIEGDAGSGGSGGSGPATPDASISRCDGPSGPPQSLKLTPIA